MNESQERREELLRMSRQKWRKGSIPAVHPRYQHVYRGLYGEHSSEENGGSSFFARMFISFLIFGMFVAADYTGEKIWKSLVCGSFIVESVFGWPGIGTFAMSAIGSRDYPVIMAYVMLSGFLLVVGNFIADLLYAFVDPRIKRGGASGGK